MLGTHILAMRRVHRFVVSTASSTVFIAACKLLSKAITARESANVGQGYANMSITDEYLSQFTSLQRDWVAAHILYTNNVFAGRCRKSSYLPRV